MEENMAAAGLTEGLPRVSTVNKEEAKNSDRKVQNTEPVANINISGREENIKRPKLMPRGQVEG